MEHSGVISFPDGEAGLTAAATLAVDQAGTLVVRVGGEEMARYPLREVRLAETDDRSTRFMVGDTVFVFVPDDPAALRGALETGRVKSLLRGGGTSTSTTGTPAYCSACGESIHPDAEICPSCGVRRRPAEVTYKRPPERSRTTAGWLALLLGGIGVHKFYLDRPLVGIAYLVFSPTLIPAIIGFVEGIIYLSQTDEDFQRKYVERRP